MRKIAFYGGSFDPVHNGHLAIARRLTEIFAFDEFVFIPAFHAPHKSDRTPTSAFHRYAMLALTTAKDERIKISTVELDAPEKPFTFETQEKLKNELTDAQIFFVIGADSWNEIDTWREWGKVLTLTNIAVVTRPGYELNFLHVTEEIKSRIVDLRVQSPESKVQSENQRYDYQDEKTDFEGKDLKLWTLDSGLWTKIFITNAVQMDVSASKIRQMIREEKAGWREFVPEAAADYIEKYSLYLK
ncbi:MAG: nicotinate-nucleotide adenylyltransferase [Pyrinomonadaceae bacterium]